jgi:hypothetical protein
MPSIVLPAAVAFVFAMVTSAQMSPANAIPRTFVASGGGGVACTRAAPCANFQAAHNATDANGEINCIDAGDFLGVIISKSITIDCAGTLGALTGTGVTIDTASVTVRLRNLTISQPVRFQNGAALFVEHCTITGTTAVPGLSTFPPTGVTARLFVSDSTFTELGGIAILVRSQGTGSSRATLDGVRIEGNTGNGLVANGQSGTGPVLVHVRNSVLSKNASGIAAATTAPGQSVVSVTVDRTSSTFGSFGIAATGPSTFMLVGRSTVISNTTGINAGNGATIFSYRNNHLTGNVTDGAPNAALSLR